MASLPHMASGTLRAPLDVASEASPASRIHRSHMALPEWRQSSASIAHVASQCGVRSREFKRRHLTGVSAWRKRSGASWHMSS